MRWPVLLLDSIVDEQYLVQKVRHYDLVGKAEWLFIYKAHVESACSQSELVL